MTDPTGRSFLSYRRSRKEEAALLIAAQHDHGIPTWQDVRDLDEAPTEEEIRRVLDDPTTANALLWITPEVADSPFIRTVEAPKILQRAGQDDRFFAIPCAAGGLDYGDAAKALGSPLILQDLEQWNIRKISADPIGPSEAAEVARRVLCRRLAAVHRTLPEGEPLRLGLFTRARPAFQPGMALVLDWTGRFNGREADPLTWEERLLPALRVIADAVRSQAPGRSIEVSGLASIAAATALGAAFLAPGGHRTAWLQETPGRSPQHWSLDAVREPTGFVPTTFGKAVEATDCAVLVSVAGNVAPAFTASQASLPPFRVVTHVEKPGISRYDIATPGQAVDIAYTTIEAMRHARQEYCPTGTVHLFMAVPVGLGKLIGQLLNTFGPVQLYEHIPDGTIGRYRLAVRLSPSI